jgi:hypothetical protein
MSREYKLHLRVQLEDAEVSTCPTEPTATKFIPPYTLQLALSDPTTRHFTMLSSYIGQLVHKFW